MTAKQQMKLVAHLIDRTEVIGVWEESNEEGLNRVLANLVDGAWLGITEEATGDILYIPPHRINVVRLMSKEPTE